LAPACGDRAGQAARACVLRPGLAVGHRARRDVTSSTPRCHTSGGATANGACARTPEPPALSSGARWPTARPGRRTQATPAP